jgi:hypothetical protein
MAMAKPGAEGSNDPLNLFFIRSSPGDRSQKIIDPVLLIEPLDQVKYNRLFWSISYDLTQSDVHVEEE